MTESKFTKTLTDIYRNSIARKQQYKTAWYRSTALKIITETWQRNDTAKINWNPAKSLRIGQRKAKHFISDVKFCLNEETTGNQKRKPDYTWPVWPYSDKSLKKIKNTMVNTNFLLTRSKTKPGTTTLKHQVYEPLCFHLYFSLVDCLNE